MGSDLPSKPKGRPVLTKILVVYSTVLTTLLAAFTLAGSAAAKVQRFDEIDVHRLNVREPERHSPHGDLQPCTPAVRHCLIDRNGRKRIVLQVTSDGTPSNSF